MEPSHSKRPRPVALSRAASGAAMDRVIERDGRLSWKVGIAVVLILLVGFMVWLVLGQRPGRSLVVDHKRIVISSVSEGVFEDFIPIRGRVTPKKTVYLDAVEGGRVERRPVEDGAMLRAGDLIVTLSNIALQLDVSRNEAMVTEQLNDMRTLELQLEQNRLQHKSNLVELDYQIKRLSRQVERLADLESAGVVIRSQLEDARDELEYYQNRRIVTLESQASDARLQETQLVFLRTTSARLQQNLGFARQNLDALNVRAPVSGKLSGFDVEVGQSIQRGGRLGQIDDPASFKLRASIDEYYLDRVEIGQSASIDHSDEHYQLRVAKIYPQVNNGQFEVDLLFEKSEPEGIRRGQSIQARLTLGDAGTALLIPTGAFYQDTGGNWMFVLSADETEAVKRSVRLGRRNSRYIEVLDGLEPGESVVTSPYSSFRDMDLLKLTDE